jgi:hypothetical protein
MNLFVSERKKCATSTLNESRGISVLVESEVQALLQQSARRRTADCRSMTSAGPRCSNCERYALNSAEDEEGKEFRGDTDARER